MILFSVVCLMLWNIAWHLYLWIRNFATDYCFSKGLLFVIENRDRFQFMRTKARIGWFLFIWDFWFAHCRSCRSECFGFFDVWENLFFLKNDIFCIILVAVGFFYTCTALLFFSSHHQVLFLYNLTFLSWGLERISFLHGNLTKFALFHIFARWSKFLALAKIILNQLQRGHSLVFIILYGLNYQFFYGRWHCYSFLLHDFFNRMAFYCFDELLLGFCFPRSFASKYFISNNAYGPNITIKRILILQ